jgi:hypothetical protein
MLLALLSSAGVTITVALDQDAAPAFVALTESPAPVCDSGITPCQSAESSDSLAPTVLCDDPHPICVPSGPLD